MLIPADVVRGCPQYRIEMRGVAVPHGTWVAVCGTDLVRTLDDGFVVLEDNLRVPSGVSYMIANRKVVKTSLRRLYRSCRVREVEHYGQVLLQTLRDLAPDGCTDPCIVLLTPGVYNSAFYEHMFLAYEIGASLVEGRDLLVNDGFVYMRTTTGLRRVDVIYRRVDDDFLDPLVFRPDSLLGVPGLLHAFKLGNVALANAPGTGVADDKSVYAYVPDMIRYYLGEEPILANVETRLCRRPEDLEYTLDNLENLVVKRVGESGGYGMLIGPHATPAERTAYAEELRADPADFISQPVLSICQARPASSRAAPSRVTLTCVLLSSTAAKPASCPEPSAAWHCAGAASWSIPAKVEAARTFGYWRTECSRAVPKGYTGWAATLRGRNICAACCACRWKRWWTGQFLRSILAGAGSTLP